MTKTKNQTSVLSGEAKIIRMAIGGFASSDKDTTKKYPVFIEIDDTKENGAMSAVSLFKALYPQITPSLDSALVLIDLATADEELLKNASSTGQVMMRFKSVAEALGTRTGDTVKIYKTTTENGSMYFDLRKV